MQEVRVRIGEQETNYDHRADVEEQDTPEYIVDGFWYSLMRVFALAGCDADELSALKGECCNHRNCDDRAGTANEWRIASCPVAGTRRAATDDARDQQYAEYEEQQHHADLDAGKDILTFAIRARRQIVQDEQYHDKDTAPDDSRDVWKPEFHDEGAGDDFDGQRDRPVQPVVPADRKAHRRIDETAGIGAE